MWVDRILAILALALFATFLSIVAFKVQRTDLFIACALGLGMAAFDFWRQLFRRSR